MDLKSEPDAIVGVSEPDADPIVGVSLRVCCNFSSTSVPKMEGLCVVRDKPVFLTVSLPAETWSQRSLPSFSFEWIVRLCEPASVEQSAMETSKQIVVADWKEETNGFTARMKKCTIPKGTRESVAEFRRAFNLHGSVHSEPCTFIRVTLNLGPDPTGIEVGPSFVAVSDRLYVCSDRHMRDMLSEVPKKPGKKRKLGAETPADIREPTEDPVPSVPLPDVKRVKHDSDRVYSDQQRQLKNAEQQTLVLLEQAFERGEFRPAPVFNGYVPVKSEVTKREKSSPKRSGAGGRSTTI
jgi:hypothetical protein